MVRPNDVATSGTAAAPITEKQPLMPQAQMNMWPLPSLPSDIIAVARLNKVHGVNQAEVAVIVSDAYQGQGLGTQLLRSLLEIARREGLDRLVAAVLPQNRAMLQVFERLGFQSHYSVEEQVVQAQLRL